MAVFLAVMALAGAVLVGNPALWFMHPDPGPVIDVYRGGVPHTDRQGRAITRYVPEQSFLPIGIYHALSGRHHGRDYDLAAVQAAGFNTVHFWEGQPIGPAVAAATRAGLQVLVHDPSPADVVRLRGSPAVLGWYLDEEPTLRAWDPDWRTTLENFRQRRTEIRAVDPQRPVFALDSPRVDPPWRERWLAWSQAGDVAAHWNYPVRKGAPAAISGRRGVAETVSDAVAANGEAKPVWLVVQAFESPLARWRMPQPEELRAMVYAGIVHGATGIVYFAYDSFVTRDGQVIGVAPDTRPIYGLSPDYNGDGKLPIDATPQTAAQSRTLWQSIAELNRELATLTPAILSPTAALGYSVVPESGGGGVRTLLKRTGDGLVLFTVNMAPEAADVRFQVPGYAGLPKVLVGQAVPEAAGEGWRERLSGFAVRVYQLSPPGPATAVPPVRHAVRSVPARP